MKHPGLLIGLFSGALFFLASGLDPNPHSIFRDVGLGVITGVFFGGVTWAQTKFLYKGEKK